jgi:hypothetical protein
MSALSEAGINFAYSPCREVLTASLPARRMPLTFCGRLPAPSLRPCEMHTQMRPRPYSRAGAFHSGWP